MWPGCPAHNKPRRDARIEMKACATIVNTCLLSRNPNAPSWLDFNDSRPLEFIAPVHRTMTAWHAQCGRCRRFGQLWPAWPSRANIYTYIHKYICIYLFNHTHILRYGKVRPLACLSRRQQNILAEPFQLRHSWHQVHGVQAILHGFH